MNQGHDEVDPAVQITIPVPITFELKYADAISIDRTRDPC